MAKTPVEKVFKDILEVEPLLKYDREDKGTSAVYRFRLIEASTEPRIRVDVREFIKSDKYTGYTGRGVGFRVEEVDEVISRLTQLKKKGQELLKVAVKKGGKK